jgi:hypothetical protein
MGLGGNAHRAHCCELVAVGVVVVTSSLALLADVAIARRPSSVVRCSLYIVHCLLVFVRCPPLSVVGRAGDVAATGVGWLRGGR